MTEANNLIRALEEVKTAARRYRSDRDTASGRELERLLRDVVAVRPEYAVFYKLAAEIHADQDRWSDVVRIVREARAADSTAREIREFSTQLLRRIATGKKLAGEPLLDALRLHLEIDPADQGAHVAYIAALFQADRTDDALAHCERALAQQPELTLLKSEDFDTKRAKAAARGVPAIFANTMFKSASLFLADALSRGLDAPSCYLTPPGVSRRLVSSAVHDFARGRGAVCQEHAVADEETLNLLRANGLTRFVVHIRDPRQQAISAIHHWRRMKGKGSIYEQIEARKCLERIGHDGIQEQLGQYLGTFFPEAVAWIEGWISVADAANGFDIKIMTYEDLHRDSAAYLNAFLDHYRLPDGMFDHAAVDLQPRAGARHFRRGETDEWRGIFSEDQRRRAWEPLAVGVAQRFGWKR